MPRKKIYKADQFVDSFEHNKLINWNELSILMTGKSNSIRKKTVPPKFHDEIVKLMVFVTRWANRNKHEDYYFPRATIKKGNTVMIVKNPPKAKLFTEVQKLPEGCVKIEKGIYKKDNLFYTSRFSINSGLDIKEWYSIKQAKEYLENKS